jgi:hypothetical protein
MADDPTPPTEQPQEQPARQERKQAKWPGYKEERRK